MRKIILLFIVFVFTTSVSAQRFEAKGYVLEIVSGENSTASPNNNLSAIFIDEFESAGACYKASSNGHVLIRIRDNAQGKLHSSMVLAAFVAGKKIEVRVDSTSKDQYGACYLKQIRMNKDF